MSLNRAIMAALLLAGCSGQEVVDEPITAFDENQNVSIDALVARIDKLEQRQAVMEKHAISQPVANTGKTGSELLAEHNADRKLENRLRALEDHQY